jgi:protein SCO1/2
MNKQSVFQIAEALLALLLFSSSLYALEKPGTELQEVGIAAELGTQVNLGLKFTDANGKELELRELVSDGRPLVIVPAYYECPRLCGLLLSGVTDLINKLSVSPGKDFRLATVSFNVGETPKLARKRKDQYSDRYTGKGEIEEGWKFLVGDFENVDTLMNQIGFNYKPDGKEFAHTAAIVLLTPEGKISQYFTGIKFSSFDLRLALVEASDGNIGSALDHVLLFCFRFDPTKGRYAWAAWGVMRAGGLLTAILLFGMIYRLARREGLASSASAE